ncbi:hypothetical protein MJM04_36485, partial [Salmonella enterica subsp. enterica serovar Cerro]|nr:hypothetical protein [Salmonella enterica subsp. enterica serovar Cerro]
ESEQRIDNNPGLLPLVLVAHGEAIAEKMWNKFKNEDNIWFKSLVSFFAGWRHKCLIRLRQVKFLIKKPGIARFFLRLLMTLT